MAKLIPLPKRHVGAKCVHYRCGKQVQEFASDADAVAWAKSTVTDDVLFALAVLAAAKLRKDGMSFAQIANRSLSIEFENGSTMGVVNG